MTPSKSSDELTKKLRLRFMSQYLFFFFFVNDFMNKKHRNEPEKAFRVRRKEDTMRRRIGVLSSEQMIVKRMHFPLCPPFQDLKYNTVGLPRIATTAQKCSG